MKEHPQLFVAPMVRALLADQKTHTRRILAASNSISAGPKFDRLDLSKAWVDPGPSPAGNHGPYLKAPLDDTTHRIYSRVQVGDRLWVRETWRIGSWSGDGSVALDYRASPEIVRTPWLRPEWADFKKLAKESLEDCKQSNLKRDWNGAYHWEHGHSPCRWRPSIFMRRWGSRVLLEVTGIRVERLNEITEADASAEGIRMVPFHYDGGHPRLQGFVFGDDPDPVYYPTARAAYRAGWESLHGAGSWALNPWVWVRVFRRLS